MKTENRKSQTGTDRRAGRDEFRKRTFQFGIRCIRVAETLPRSSTADIIARQLIRSATSVGANYRAAIRGRSPAEFIAKLGLVEEECDEARYWLETLIALELIQPARVVELQREGDAIIAIAIASIRTARKHGK